MSVHLEENAAGSRVAEPAVSDANRQYAETTQRHRRVRDCSSTMSGSLQHLPHNQDASGFAPIAPERLTGRNFQGPFLILPLYQHVAQRGCSRIGACEIHEQPHARESDSGSRTKFSAGDHRVDTWVLQSVGTCRVASISSDSDSAATDRLVKLVPVVVGLRTKVDRFHPAQAIHGFLPRTATAVRRRSRTTQVMAENLPTDRRSVFENRPFRKHSTDCDCAARR